MTDMPPHRHARKLLFFCACVLVGGCATVPGPGTPGAAGGDATSTADVVAAVPAAPSAPSALPAGDGGAPTARSDATTTSAAASSASSASSASAPASAAAPGTDPAARPADAAAPASAASAPAAVTVRPPPVPRSQLDPAQDSARIDLWERIRDGMALPELEGDLVRKWEDWYASRPDYVQRMTERGARYLFHIVEEVERRGLPTDLALLPFIESAFNPQAHSRASAAGMWQFMPATGKDYELRQNLFRDDRRDVLASTRAALDFLEKLYARFGDWHLALAAYNWGPGNVQRAIDRNRRARKPVDYARLMRVPAETREYVPKLQAVKNIVLRPEAFGLVLPELHNHPYFLSVTIERDIDVALAASLAGLPLEEFQQLNPQHNKPVILAAGTPQVLLPYDNANRFVREVAQHPGPLASWTAWVAPRTLKPNEAARLTGMSEERLREVNRIPARMVVTRGSTLLVPRNGEAVEDVPEHIADNARIALAPDGPPLRRVVLRAGRRGESVASVARRYRVSAQAVALWNDTSPGARFAPGQRIVMMLPARPAKAARSAKARTARATARKDGSAKLAERPASPRAPARVRSAPR